MITAISAADCTSSCKPDALLIDVRSEAEYRREHIDGALCVPLAQLQQQGLPAEAKHAPVLVFHCLSGVRTQQAAALLTSVTEGREAYIMESGLQGWRAAGLLTVVDRSQPLDLMRQVQIAAGSLALLGAIGGWLVSPWFYLLCAMVGSGLLLAGLTGFCGMARLLAKMPWNRQAV